MNSRKTDNRVRLTRDDCDVLYAALEITLELYESGTQENDDWAIANAGFVALKKVADKIAPRPTKQKDS